MERLDEARNLDLLNQPAGKRQGKNYDVALPKMTGSETEDDGLEIQLLLTGPADEANLYDVLGGTLDNEAIYRTLLTNGDGQSAAKIVTDDHEVDDFLEPSMLGCFLAPWRCGQRGTRKRGRSWRVEVKQLFGPQHPCTSGDEKCRSSRKNNEHWTEDEMVKLVYGVSKKGLGKWSKTKDKYLSTSIRTPVHLKDKWRNLVRACKAKSTSKIKVNVQKGTELTVRRFRHRILAIEDKRLSKKKK